MHPIPKRRIGYLVLVTLLFLVSSLPASESTRGWQRLADLRESLDGYLLQENDLRGLRREARGDAALEDETLLLEAAFERRMRRDPVAALRLIAPRLGIDATTLREWERGMQTAQRDADAAHRTAQREARQRGETPPLLTPRMHVPFPGLSGWTMTEETVPFAVDAARSFSAMGEADLAVPGYPQKIVYKGTPGGVLNVEKLEAGEHVVVTRYLVPTRV